jgi:hypothetical protein
MPLKNAPKTLVEGKYLMIQIIEIVIKKKRCFAS